MEYTGGAFDMTIDTSEYGREEAEADFDTCLPLILSLEADTRHISTALLMNPKIEQAFGRFTSFLDYSRGIAELWQESKDGGRK